MSELSAEPDKLDDENPDEMVGEEVEPDHDLNLDLFVEEAE